MPREIAAQRYTQHHEWMEEVVGSAYPINRIKPVDLGLGLAGELEAITRGEKWSRASPRDVSSSSSMVIAGSPRTGGWICWACGGGCDCLRRFADGGGPVGMGTGRGVFA